MHNLIEYNDNSTGSLQQYHRDETTFSNDVPVTPTTSNPESFKFKNKSITNIYVNGTENIEIAVLLKYLSNSLIFKLLLNFH